MTGTVLDARTQEPLFDVRVTATSAEPERVWLALTHTNGVYRLRELPAGRYAVRFERESFQASTLAVTVTAGQLSRLDAQLVPVPAQKEAAGRNAVGAASSPPAGRAAQAQGLSTVIGTVLDASTLTPLLDVEVTLTSPEMRGEQVVFTESKGVYQLSELRGGNYSLRFARANYRPYSVPNVPVGGGRVSRIDAQLSPEAWKGASVTTTDVVVTPRRQAPAPFSQTLPLAQAEVSSGGVRSFSGLAAIAEATPPEVQGAGGFSTFAGTVVDASTFAPLQGVVVTATSAQHEVAGAAITRPKGDFRFRQLPAGTYTLRFQKDGYELSVSQGVTVAVDQMLLLDVALAPQSPP